MRDDSPPSQPKSCKEFTVLSISICQKWIPDEFDIVTMLASSGLCHPVLALLRPCKKKKLREKKLERFRHIIDCPVPNGTTLVCVSRMWMAQFPLVSYLGKEFPDAHSEYHCGRVFLGDDKVIHGRSVLWENSLPLHCSVRKWD
jgi:hypothetical protein